MLRLPGRLCCCSSVPRGGSGGSGCHCVNLHLLILTFLLKTKDTNLGIGMWPFSHTIWVTLLHSRYCVTELLIRGIHRHCVDVSAFMKQLEGHDSSGL